MAKLRINGDSSGYVDLEAPNAASSSTIDLDQVPQKNVANTFTTHQVIRTDTASGGYTAYPSLTLRNDNVNGYSVLHFHRGATTQSARIEVDNNNGSPTIGMYATSAGNGIKVDHNGYVTKPQQPAWSGGLSGSQSGLITSYIVRLNNGNHFSNGVFTCPVAGNYFISFFAMTSSAGAMDVELRINGSTNNGLVPYSCSAGFHTSAGGTTVLYLNANDTIQMHNNNTQLYGNSTGRHTGFSGYLIG